MRFSDIIHEYKTKLGQQLTFTFDEDNEGDVNRGWVVHKINVMVDGENVGYLKISYIPKERFDAYYPTVFNYMSQIAGMGVLPLDKRHLHYNEFTDDELDDLIKRTGGHDRRYSKYWNEHVPTPVARAEKLKLIADMEKGLEDSKKQFDRFAKSTVDKPIVDYISVEPSSQRQHIALALYLTAAEWMKKKGLKLYASGLQSDPAKAAWDYMEKHLDVAYDGDRRYLKV